MKEFFLNKFLSEVQKVETDLTEEEIQDLKVSGLNILNALLSRRLILHDPGTYALAFVTDSFPFYFTTFRQTKEALLMLLRFIKKDESFFDLPDKELPEIVNYLIFVKSHIEDSLNLFLGFFRNDEAEQERILFAIKNLRFQYSEEGIQKYLEICCDSIEDQISYLESMLFDFKQDEELKVYFGSEIWIFESRVQRILMAKSAERQLSGIKHEIKEQFENSHSNLEIFHPNGFKLFDYLVKNHLSSGSGYQSDIAFFYRKMVYDGLIHAKHNRFKIFLEKVYPDLEPLGKIKQLKDINTKKREQIYDTAKWVVGLK
ncbi:hypothetical protein [Cyclobacterium sp.]|uniref:hypothetical protein n=1 Tax=Cyclobacterium sp. TaxID=1966343 RepID=UPI0019C33988|nr:hypothetical protein [Cyclobacterium sp.]MBD3627662.1 hypothetical protein [Cyclobacterium sp.]